MYDRFVELYDFIFPLKPAQRSFVLRHVRGYHRFLDIGCSTGALAASLDTEFSDLTAIDYSPEMVEKAAARRKNVTYVQGDMRTLSSTVSGHFDGITCFGNTLVHLSSPEEVAQFFGAVRELLSDDGVFLFQILNYDRILRDRPEALPTIENDEVKFTRLYHYDLLPHIRFETELLDKKGEAVVTGEVKLLSIEPEMIRTLLKESGFSAVSFFGTYGDDPFTEDSFPLIVKASL